jgi:hypothetical protein
VRRAASSEQRVGPRAGDQGLHVHGPGGLHEVDVHDGIDATLTILNDKLKHTRIAVERRCAAALPPGETAFTVRLPRSPRT